MSRVIVALLGLLFVLASCTLQAHAQVSLEPDPAELIGPPRFYEEGNRGVESELSSMIDDLPSTEDAQFGEVEFTGLQAVVVPEPSAFVLLGAALFTLALLRASRRKTALT